MLMKKIFIKTHGCQMNFYDSERMTDLLKPHGYQLDDNQDDADLIILNTCHIREKAVEKTYSELGRIREKINIRKANTGKRSIVVVAGCVAQAQGKEIMKRSPWVDIVVGPQSYQNLPELIAKVDPINKIKNIDIGFPTIPKFDQLNTKIEGRGPSAFLTIQEGCDKFCTFCVVPYTRGAEYSRPLMSIIEEAKKLIDIGVKEITLLGQNVNAWCAKGLDDQNWGLGKLIDELAKINELKFIRYTTSHPLDMDIDLIKSHRDNKKLMPYLHLPAQSGSDNVLKMMNRKHTAKEYLKIIEKVRDYNPKIAISGDFIVGFPGETDKDHTSTLSLIKQVNYAQAYSFKYSKRPGTPGSVFLNHLNEDLKKSRLYEVQELLRSQQLSFNEKTVNSTMKVLVLKKGKKKNQYIGRSPFNQSVYFKSRNESMIGSFIDLNITEAFQNSLTGNIISDF